MKEFRDKVAVITGAASGIGRGLAERCAQEGMKVVLVDIEEGALAQTERDIRAMGAATLAVKADVSKASNVEALARKTLDSFGGVHLLCNNAGVAVHSSAWESTLADWEWVLGVNLWGVIYGVHFFLPIMLAQGAECHIINMSSVAGLYNGAYTSPYAVSKHGVVALSETLYREMKLEGHNIRVSVLCPGLIETNLKTCERNRPAELQNDPALERRGAEDPNIQAVMQFYSQGTLPRMSPAQLADIVFAAIRENQFYILPNGETYLPSVRARMEDVVQGRNPTRFPGLE